MTKNALLISANESYQRGEEDLEKLTGMKVSHSTLQRLVQRQEFELPIAKQQVQEMALDGGKVRLRDEEKGKPSYWKDYKATTLDQLHCAAFFQDNQSLIDWVNSQEKVKEIRCIGDGHAGVWNIFKEIGNEEKRIEILDWYHLKENLYAVGGSKKRLKIAESLLWSGKKAEVIELFQGFKKPEFEKFCQYVKTHYHRIINYKSYQEERIGSIGSGAVESLIKQIGFRLKITGAQWNINNVPQTLLLRCSYLNGDLSR